MSINSWIAIQLLIDISGCDVRQYDGRRIVRKRSTLQSSVYVF